MRAFGNCAVQLLMNAGGVSKFTELTCSGAQPRSFNSPARVSTVSALRPSRVKEFCVLSCTTISMKGKSYAGGQCAQRHKLKDGSDRERGKWICPFPVIARGTSSRP